MTLHVDSEIELRLLKMSDAEDIYRTIDNQRSYLRTWLPFVDKTQHVDSIKEFVEFINNKPEEDSEFAFTIRKNDQFVGLIDIKTTDLLNRKTELGYWLSEDFQGQGIMTKAVERICEYAFDELQLNRVQIKCAVGNLPSKNIPKRLGFVLEGIERDGELMPNDEYVDLEIYSKLKADK